MLFSTTFSISVVNNFGGIHAFLYLQARVSLTLLVGKLYEQNANYYHEGARPCAPTRHVVYVEPIANHLADKRLQKETGRDDNWGEEKQADHVAGVSEEARRETESQEAGN